MLTPLRVLAWPSVRVAACRVEVTMGASSGYWIGLHTAYGAQEIKGVVGRVMPHTFGVPPLGGPYTTHPQARKFRLKAGLQTHPLLPNHSRDALAEGFRPDRAAEIRRAPFRRRDRPIE